MTNYRPHSHISGSSATETATNRRSELLSEADRLINGDRNNAYGPPSQDFERTALLWSTYLSGRRMIESHDVAVMMILLKVSRLSWSANSRDSWVDIAGYASCGWDALQTHISEIGETV